MEPNIKISGAEIIWSYYLDVGQPVNPRHIAEKIRDLSVVKGLLVFKGPTERHEGISDIYSFSDEAANFLKILELANFDVLHEEFFESQAFIRCQLQGFQIQHPYIGTAVVNVLLTVHASGSLIFHFWAKIDQTQELKNFYDLLLLPREEAVTDLVGILPFEIVQEYANAVQNQDLMKRIEAHRAKGKKSLKIPVTMTQLGMYYFRSIASSIVKNPMRGYEQIDIFPTLIVNKTNPSYEEPDQLLEQCPKQIFTLLTLANDPSYLFVREGERSKDLLKNLSEAIDYAFLLAPESGLIIKGTKWLERLDIMSKSANQSPQDYDLYENLRFLTIIEILGLQRYILRIITSQLVVKPLQQMSVKEIIILKNHLSEGLEMLYNTGLVSSRWHLDVLIYGKEVLQIANQQNMLLQKINIIDQAVETIHALRMEFASIALGIIFAFVPVLIEIAGQENPWSIPLALLLGSTVVAVTLLGSFIVSGWYWKRGQKSK
ncbi:MAG: hypothetical protein ACFFC7_06725 [Candidatus Hermodarchaeota archaeon]